jgi:hypothetical protein
MSPATTHKLIVHFVGSIPLPDAETVFRSLATATGLHTSSACQTARPAPQDLDPLSGFDALDNEPTRCQREATAHDGDSHSSAAVALVLGVRRPSNENPTSCCVELRIFPCTLLQRWHRLKCRATAKKTPPGRRLWSPRILNYFRAGISHFKRQYRSEPALFSIQVAA